MAEVPIVYTNHICWVRSGNGFQLLEAKTSVITLWMSGAWWRKTPVQSMVLNWGSSRSCGNKYNWYNRGTNEHHHSPDERRMATQYRLHLYSWWFWIGEAQEVAAQNNWVIQNNWVTIGTMRAQMSIITLQRMATHYRLHLAIVIDQNKRGGGFSSCGNSFISWVSMPQHSRASTL